MSERDVAGALGGLRGLVALIERRELVRFLGAFHPFGAGSVPAAPDLQRVAVAEILLLQPGTRPSW